MGAVASVAEPRVPRQLVSHRPPPKREAAMNRHLIPLVAFAGLAVAACGTKADRQDTETANAAPAGAPEAAPTSVPAPALDDATIVAIFDAANTFDVETSELALKKAQSK